MDTEVVFRMHLLRDQTHLTCSSEEIRVPLNVDINKKSRATPPGTKKVSVKEDGTGGAFTISSTLDNK